MRFIPDVYFIIKASTNFIAVAVIIEIYYLIVLMVIDRHEKTYLTVLNFISFCLVY